LSKCSLQARSSSLQGWGLINLPLHVFFQFPITFSRVAWSILDCAQRLPLFVSWKDTPVGLRAAVERGPSQGARSGSTGPTGVSFHPIPLSCAFREHRRPIGHSPITYSDFSPLCPQGEWPRSPFTARIERYVCSLQACSLPLQGWGLIDLPLRASNEGSPRPRVARA